MTKEQKFYKALQDVFIGAKIEGEGGFVNLMRIKSNYYRKIEDILKKDIEAALKSYPKFRDELFDKLYSFFSRYFTESGSIYFNSTPFHNNIYEKVYTDEKDVILFWKTQMLYYVKTDRIFKSLDFESDGFKFFFDASKIESKKANEKRSLIFELKEIKEDETIVFKVLYSERGTKTKPDEILKAIKSLSRAKSREKGIVITEEQLERALRIFEKQSEVDFFINKNAKAFLQEQFKLWSYQYFWEGLPVEASAESGAKEWGADRVNQLQILKDIAFKIIDFISQFEDELVGLENMEQQINPFIESVSINLFDGIFNSEVRFRNGLNIISGENGTGKTQLIQRLKSGSTKKFFGNRNTDRVVVFNPLRNAEKITQEQIVQRLRSQDLNLRKINDALRGFAINDQELTTYYSFGAVFVLTYEDLLYTGNITIQDAVMQARDEFNQVLQRVFPQYEIIAKWRDKQLYLSVNKQQKITIPLNALSRGESEVFALLFNIYANRNQEDVFLIDEPELHLNWDLERGLFRFLNWFCEEFKKQIIVATHSRVVFEGEFLTKTQFLVWEANHIVVKAKPTDQIRQKIAGDALQLVTAFDIGRTVFYVEDELQKRVLEFLRDHLSKKFFTFVVNGRPNVQNLCRYLTSEGYKYAYFVADSDNQGVPKELEKNSQYIQLRKYCIENYFLNYFILAKVANKTEKEIKNIIREAIKNSPEDQHTKSFKKLAEISDVPSEVLDTYNAKRIIETVSKFLGLNSSTDLIDKFLKKCVEENKVEEIFEEIASVIKTVKD
jgi:predicted ATPase